MHSTNSPNLLRDEFADVAREALNQMTRTATRQRKCCCLSLSR
jgi:hypothetical protein